MYAGVILKNSFVLPSSQCVFPVYAGVILVDVSACQHRIPVFPVYAGVILVITLAMTLNRCVPRVCGGDPRNVEEEGGRSWCSPCMRG